MFVESDSNMPHYTPKGVSKRGQSHSQVNNLISGKSPDWSIIKCPTLPLLRVIASPWIDCISDVIVYACQTGVIS